MRVNIYSGSHTSPITGFLCPVEPILSVKSGANKRDFNLCST